MDLRHLTDQALLVDIKISVTRERELTTWILHHLLEIDRRKLYSDLGYSSLYDYAIRELKYPEASAHRRIQAARLLGKIPEIEKKIETGALSMANIAQAQTFFNQNDVKDLKQQREILKEVEGMSKARCEKKLFELSGKEIQVKESTKRISENQSRVTVILSDETLKKLQHLKDLIGENPSMDQLISLMADEAIKNKEKKKFKLTDKPRPPSPVEVRKRTVSASVKRAVFTRDKVCTKCGSRHNLNFDHRKAYALGGTSSRENIRLLCGNCNQRERIRAKL